MPKVGIATYSRPEWIETLCAAGWTVRTFPIPDLTLVGQDSVPDFDVIILDAGGEFPSNTVQEICARKPVPVLVVLPGWTFANEVHVAGADEVMVVPVNTNELLFRLRALVYSSRIVRVANLLIDLSARRVRVRNLHIRLTPVEFRFLACLVGHLGEVVSCNQILKDVWGCTPESGGTLSQVKNCVSRLRKKIEPDSFNPQYIVSVRGGGYRLRNQAQWQDANPHPQYQT
jgi:two-component system KDP operon response regulator KdpE